MARHVHVLEAVRLRCCRNNVPLPVVPPRLGNAATNRAATVILTQSTTSIIAVVVSLLQHSQAHTALTASVVLSYMNSFDRAFLISSLPSRSCVPLLSRGWTGPGHPSALPGDCSVKSCEIPLLDSHISATGQS
ncbi:unnamed protein product [Sphacelaria rigidula]